MKKRQIADFEGVSFEAVSQDNSTNLIVSAKGDKVTVYAKMSPVEVIELRDWLNEITGHPTPRLITHEDVHTLLHPGFPGLVNPTTGPSSVQSFPGLVDGTYVGSVDLPGIRIGHDEGYNGGGQRTVIEDGKKVTEPIPALDQRGLSAGLVLDAKEIAERRAILSQEALKPHVPDALTVAHLPSIEKRLKAEGMEFMDMSDREAKGK